MPEHKVYTATLERAIELSEQTRHLEFRVADLEHFDFKAGQFISIKQPKPDGRHVTRAYSVASPPRGDGSFDLCLNRVDDGFMSNFLCNLRPGQEIFWHGPHGLFTLHEPLQDSLFICTGTGVAPFRSMLHHLLADPQRAAGRQFWLIFGTRYPQDLYYADEFRRLEHQNPNFHYIATLSRADASWQGLRGYVQEHVRQLLQSCRLNGAGTMHAYICGLHEMVDANRKMLLDLGWDRKSIFYERYD